MASVSGLLRDRVTAVWAVLMIATVLSFTLGHKAGRGGHPLTSSIIIVIALYKVRLIGLYFMEFRDAPKQLRGAFEAYCLVLCTVMIGLFLVH